VRLMTGGINNTPHGHVTGRPAFHHGGLGSVPGQSMWGVLCTK